MNIYSIKNFKGFSLVEILIVISISAVILSTTLYVFTSMGDMQSVDKDVEVVQSYLNKSRNQTVNSKGGLQYGVHFSSTSVTLFEGSTYVAGASTNSVYNFSNKTELQSLSLSGQNRIVFERLTGKPSATGTIMFRLRGNPSVTKSITVHGTGLVESN